MSDLTISLTANSMEGTGAVDPQVTVLLIQTTEPQQTLRRWTIAFDSSVVLACPIPEDSFPIWQVMVLFSRFDAGKNGSYSFEPRGEPAIRLSLGVVRLTNQWTPRFGSLAGLSAPRFDPFRAIVAVSNSVDLLLTGLNQGGQQTDLGNLELTFDTLAGPLPILAKMALLNLFSVLIEEQDPIAGKPWFTHVRRFVRLGQERFIAEVDPALFETVGAIVAGLNTTYKGKGYFTELDGGRSLHTGNIPPQYDPARNLQKMETVKIVYEQGNVQLTVSFLTVEGVAVHLLDCDMDEHKNLLLHGFDLVKHLFNGGTSPVDMHEYIVRDSAQQAANHRATIDLGYQLV